MEYNREAEVESIIEELTGIIRAVLEDGANKRQAGTKPHWKIDEHYRSLMRHIYRYRKGELADEDSGQHPMAHAGVRALMIAGQEAINGRPVDSKHSVSERTRGVDGSGQSGVLQDSRKMQSVCTRGIDGGPCTLHH